MIEVKHLTKRYGNKLALDDVSFTVSDGEILGFLGPNGAGKSTTMNIITGYLSSNEGTVTIGDHEILEEPMKAKAQIGYLPEQPPLYLDMTVADYLGFMFDLKRVKKPKQEHIEEICDLLSLSDVKGRIIKNLSKGYKQRVGLAQALLGDPPLLVLDEPTVGLDPKQIIEIRNLIKGLKEKHTVILSSHVLSEIEAICDRVLMINKGKIVADDTPENLSKGLKGKTAFVAEIQGKSEQINETLEAIEGIIKITNRGEKESGVFEYLIETTPEHDVRKTLFQNLSQKDLSLLTLSPIQLDLEEVFLRLLEEEKEEEEPQDQESNEQNPAEENSEQESTEQGQAEIDQDNQENGGDKA